MYSKTLFLIGVIKIHIVCDFYAIKAYYSDQTNEWVLYGSAHFLNVCLYANFSLAQFLIVHVVN